MVPMTLIPEPPTVEAQLAAKDKRITELEGALVTASRNARALSHTMAHFQSEKVRLDLEVSRLTPTIHQDAAAAAAEPPKTLFIDSAGEVYQAHNGGVMPVGVDATVELDSMVFPVKVITPPGR